MRLNLAFAAIFAAVLSSSVWATVTVAVLGGPGTYSATQDPMTDEWVITCVATSPDVQLTQFIIEGDDDDVISSIHIDNNSAVQRCDVIIRKALSAQDGILSIGQITWGTTTGQQVHIVSMETTGDVGSIEVSAIIFAYIGNNLVGDVYAEVNAIRELIVNNQIGSSMSPVTIEAIGQIDRISTGGDVYASIDSEPSGSLSPWFGAFTTEGDFYGAITAPSASVNSGIPSGSGSFIGIRVEGESHGTIAFDRFGREEGKIDSTQPAEMEFGDPNGSNDGELSPNGKVLIAEEFGEHGFITVATAGLKGQIVINAANATSNAWEGELMVGTLTLTEEYSTLPSTIGNGAAGVAPFTIHTVASAPTQDGFVMNSQIDILDPELNCEKIEFTPEAELYGKVTLSGDVDDRITLQVWNGSTWVAAGFDLDTTLVSNGTSRRLRFAYTGSGVWPTGTYRITPKSGRISCQDVSGTPTADFAYRFTVLDGCELMLLSTFDLNSDDTVCAADIAEWTANPVDLNGDSVADANDLVLLLRAVDAYN